MKKVKLRKVGNSYGLTLPKELLEKYNIKEGEELYVVESSYGFTLTPYDPDFEEWASPFDKTNKKYKNALKELSK
ncbi:MAG: AbrB/MazE/SpoVT family DNA-binding domain-containing protein [Dethiobacter sp.]|jgi:putative addiction module antidote|nr:AbrB/MazE/SpoVT family DNA-binding domain-containing protein [Dethiobacter sp.]MBS3901121.1 AbrB/MazE/SpoVT family DNA-binding domain-containing protein [Dethiobacter sp.]MBS3990075.1 AbrB/MazE/SpoVT family DNA-binding domain-containing protein [Dethiobacter sp.]